MKNSKIFGYLSDCEIASRLADKSTDEIIYALFEHFEINCMNMYKLDNNKLDLLIEKLDSASKQEVTTEIIKLLKSVTDFSQVESPIVDKIKFVIENSFPNDISAEEIADKVHISRFYMAHLFKKSTGITISEYKTHLKISQAKKLLRTTDKNISEIAQECGFGDASYFAKVFLSYEKVSPTQYKSTLFSADMTEEDLILYNKLKHIKFLDGIDAHKIEKNKKVKAYPVAMPDDEYTFLHEAAIIKFKNTLIAAWYNNSKTELQGATPIRFSCSYNDGKTWDKAKIVVSDESGKILFCPPVFGISGDKLYMLLNQMVSADHMHSLDLYVYNNQNNCFDFLWSKPIPFKLNTNVYTLPDGKLILPGRIAELDGFPNTPAVLISGNGKINTDWQLIKIQQDGKLADGSELLHPEVSLIVNADKIYAFSRNDQRKVPLVYISDDNGTKWSKPYAHDIPLSNSKIYSGTLTDGRNYVIGNIVPGRRKLAIFFSKPNSMKFNKGYILQEGYSDDLGIDANWHYPAACEADGKLYVIYTYQTESNIRGAAVSVIDLKDV